MRRRVTAALFILSLSFNAAFLIYLLFGQGGNPGYSGHRGYSGGAAAPGNVAAVVLSPEQMQQIQPLRLRYEKSSRELRRQMAAFREKMMGALKQEPADRGTVMECIAAISALQEKVQVNAAEEILALKKHMTPQQCDCMVDGLSSAIREGAAAPCAGDCCNPGKITPPAEKKP